jgi:hypothetical protein
MVRHIHDFLAHVQESVEHVDIGCFVFRGTIQSRNASKCPTQGEEQLGAGRTVYLVSDDLHSGILYGYDAQTSAAAELNEKHKANRFVQKKLGAHHHHHKSCKRDDVVVLLVFPFPDTQKVAAKTPRVAHHRHRHHA